ncbi:MAG: Holliday junction resolvase RuvX [Synergistaceae bacterium]|jgi:putative Holliday junction resolvase|nr:Holliday junction resolvase RuvX [Synergistaceae bacterium]
MADELPRSNPRAVKGRIVALDVGAVRVGVAVSDPTGSFALAVSVLAAKGDWMADLTGILKEYQADAILVGMPRRTDGTDGPEADRMKLVAEDLASRFPRVDIILWDERFTTMIATQAMIEADVSRKKRRDKVDKVAAVVLLQSYLDYLRGDCVVSAAQDQPSGGDSRKRRGHGGKNAYT